MRWVLVKALRGKYFKLFQYFNLDAVMVFELVMRARGPKFDSWFGWSVFSLNIKIRPNLQHRPILAHILYCLRYDLTLDELSKLLSNTLFSICGKTVKWTVILIKQLFLRYIRFSHIGKRMSQVAHSLVSTAPTPVLQHIFQNVTILLKLVNFHGLQFHDMKSYN